MNLTNRELEIINFIANGFSNKEIACKLEISVRTVETYIRKIYIKMQARNRSNAVSIFITKMALSVK
jgi:DNA-binding NarL/FixJ family response regulator